MTRLSSMLIAVVIGLPLAVNSAGAQKPQRLSPDELAKRTIHRRAVDAAIWGQPIVSFDAMRQAYFRDAKAKYNDVIWWPKGAGWKNQSLTPNTGVRYIYVFSNTKDTGPVVVELPAGVEGASFLGRLVMPGGCRSSTSGVPAKTRARAANT